MRNKSGKVIKITESALERIKESHRLTEYEFINLVKSYIQNLVNDSVNAEYPFHFTANSISKDVLDELLEREGIILKSEVIVDTDSEGNKTKPKKKVSYIVAKSEPLLKIQKIYNVLFDENGERLTEEATTACSSGAYVGKAFMGPPIRMNNFGSVK